MDYAKERRSSDKLIRAENASPSRYYTCPTCSAEVFLRRGRRRTAHFRPQSEAGIKQQKLTIAKKLSNKSGGTDRDHFALYVMWRAWAWEQLGDADAVDHLL